ncbi:MAG: phosphoglucosamine mutase, partial [Verrucomicrobiota bacterium]
MSNDTRQFFGTDGIRGRANAYPLTADFVVRLGQAVAEVFLEEMEGGSEDATVVIGKDTRESGDMLESAISAGLNSRGIDVRLAGVVPTPAVAMLVRKTEAAFGVVISASHNPFEDNGIKFFGPDGYKLTDEMELEIERRVLSEAEASIEGPIGRTGTLENASATYIDFVCASAGDSPDLLSGLTIALDCANGASYETSEAILKS